ncbi:MAG: SGNH/GDSL hydrolase family protein, partial [Kiritimatiellaeota bacterium]|nr:SGNH/GDSL hydrolase family protein [Kiritimatiellota bacterium]
GGVKKDALLVIVIGANDLMQEAVAPMQFATFWADLDKEGVAVARSTEGQIQALASAGIKYVMWGNVFDVARTPAIAGRVKWLGSSLSASALAAMKKATLAHNQEMDAAILRLGKANPDLKIIKLDLYAKFAELIDHPSQYGLTDVATGANDSKHLFSADGLHPTPQGHKILAEFAFATLKRYAPDNVPPAAPPKPK